MFVVARLRRLGPGLLFAATAVGVSHLVQSTRAGAEFGLTLSALIVLACLIKYPAFRFGAEYAAIRGESVIDGYQRQGRWLLVLILVATGIEGVGAIPAVSLVAAGLTMNLLGIQANAVGVTIAVSGLATAMLLFGRYRLLENITRVFVVIFSVLSVIAAIAAATELSAGRPPWGAIRVQRAESPPFRVGGRLDAHRSQRLDLFVPVGDRPYQPPGASHHRR